jgi:hypothetical protein
MAKTKFDVLTAVIMKLTLSWSRSDVLLPTFRRNLLQKPEEGGVDSSETWITIYQTSWCHIPEGSNIQNYICSYATYQWYKEQCMKICNLAGILKLNFVVWLWKTKGTVRAIGYGTLIQRRQGGIGEFQMVVLQISCKNNIFYEEHGLKGGPMWILELQREFEILVYMDSKSQVTFGPNKDEIFGSWRKLRIEEVHNLCQV